jgi:ferredoxin
MSTVNEVEKTEAAAEASAAPVINCAVQKAIKTWADFQVDKMCGKCHPCMMGSFEVLNILGRLEGGASSDADIRRLEIITAEMLLGSRCKKGKDVAQTLDAVLKNNRDELVEHFEKGLCVHLECKPLIRYEIDADKCTMCGECLLACKFAAIAGQKRSLYASGYMPFRIRQARCTKCDACREICPEGAVTIISGGARN